MIAPHLGDSAALGGGSAAFRAESLRLSGVPHYYLEALPRRRSRLDIIDYDRKGGAFPHGLRQSRCKVAAKAL